eukprot:13067233-Alexandrium_andersonii.AAC.1
MTSSLPAPPNPWQPDGSCFARACPSSPSSSVVKPGWPTSAARLSGARPSCREGGWPPPSRTTWESSSCLASPATANWPALL